MSDMPDQKDSHSRRNFLAAMSAFATVPLISESLNGQASTANKPIQQNRKLKNEIVTLRVWLKSNPNILTVTSPTTYHFDGVVGDFYNYLNGGSKRYARVDDLVIDLESVAALQAVVS